MEKEGTTSGSVEYTIAPPTAFSMFPGKELWRYRELFYFFTWRDIKLKYKQTALGFLWAILQPFLMMLIFTIFFGRLLKDPSATIPYPVFVISGLIMWNVFSLGLTGAANSMVNNAMIIKKIYFPRVVVPISAVLIAMFDFLMALVLFAGILIYFRQPVHWNALWIWPLTLMMSFIATMGLGSWLAALNLKYRDFKYVIPFLLQILFFVTPVIYPASLVDYPGLEYVLALSPMYAGIELFRFPLTGVLPPTELLTISIASSLLLLLIGMYYFRKTEDFFADFA